MATIDTPEPSTTATMLPSVQLPAELVESILDRLDGDGASLQQCALVGHLFYNRSQKLLFKRINLGRPSDEELAIGSSPADKFYDTITNFPHLRKYVLELAISDNLDIALGDSDDWDPNSDYPQVRSWLETDDKVAKILPLLGELEDLCIWGSQPCQLFFHEWIPELQSAILAAVPSLTRLSLLHLEDVPLQILNDVPKLKHLTLNDVLFTTDGAFLPPNASRKAVVEDLDIQVSFGSEWCTLYLWFQTKECALDLTHLTSLNIKQADEATDLCELQAATWLINGCANTVRELNIWFPPEVTTPPDYDDSFIDLGSMPNLQKLSLEGYLWSWGTCNPAQNSFTWLVKVFDRIQPGTTLNHVDLSLIVMNWKRFPRAEFAGACWDDLVHALLRLEELIPISITFIIYDVRDSYIEEVVKERIALLSKRVKVNLTTAYTRDMNANDDDESV